jgi:hypothetical protein
MDIPFFRYEGLPGEATSPLFRLKTANILAIELGKFKSVHDFPGHDKVGVGKRPDGEGGNRLVSSEMVLFTRDNTQKKIAHPDAILHPQLPLETCGRILGPGLDLKDWFNGWRCHSYVCAFSALLGEKWPSHPVIPKGFTARLFRSTSQKRGNAKSSKQGIFRGIFAQHDACTRDHANLRVKKHSGLSATSTCGPVEATIAIAVVVRSRAQVPAWRSWCRGVRAFAPSAS